MIEKGEKECGGVEEDVCEEEKGKASRNSLLQFL